MSLSRLLPALLAAALLPGCAWFGGDDDDSQSTGNTFVVTLKNSGQRDVDVKLEVLEDGAPLHQDAFVAEAGKTVERELAWGVNGTKVVRLTYTMDAGGRAASGTQENSFDPSTCPGTYRVAFEVSPDEELTMVGNHGVCDTRA